MELGRRGKQFHIILDKDELTDLILGLNEAHRTVSRMNIKPPKVIYTWHAMKRNLENLKLAKKGEYTEFKIR